MSTLQDAIDVVFTANSEELAKITAAVKERSRQLRQIGTIDALTRFSIGDAVVIDGNISPKYLIGARGKILRLEGNRFAVSLDEPVGRFGGVLRVPANCLKEAT